MVNSEIYRIDISQHANFHQPSMYMTKNQKECTVQVLTSCIKIKPDDTKKFKLNLQKIWYGRSLYSLDEYFELHKN
jgi:ribosomal protein L28